MLTDDNIGLVAPRLFYPNGNPQFSWSPDRSIIGESLERIRNLTEEWKVAHDPIEKILRRLFRQGWYCAACWLIRKSAFQEIGGFDERFFLYFEDVDFCIRLRQAGLEDDQRAAGECFSFGRRFVIRQNERIGIPKKPTRLLSQASTAVGVQDAAILSQKKVSAVKEGIGPMCRDLSACRIRRTRSSWQEHRITCRGTYAGWALRGTPIG